MRRYLRILRGRAALLPFSAALVGRLPVAMTPLGIVLLVQGIRGSYSIAGVVTAGFAVGTAAATPVWGGLVDRLGQPKVNAPTSAASAALLAGLALRAVAGAGDVELVALSAAVGVAFPPISPAIRGAWRVLLDGEDDVRAAYALDAVTMETIYVGGPLLVSVLLVLTPPAVPLLVTAACLGVGGVGYCFTGAARAWRAEPHVPAADGPQGRSRGISPLRVGAVLTLLAVAAAVAIGFGQLDVTMAATARLTLGAPAKVGLLFMAISGGSAIGGLLYGSRRWPGTEAARLPYVVAGFAAGLTLMAVVLAVMVPPLWLLLVVLLVAGLWIAPAVIIAGNLVDHYSPGDRLNEAQSWLNTGFTSGGAAGTAVAGWLVDAGGPARAAVGAAIAMTVAAVICVAGQRVWRGAQTRPLVTSR